MILIRRVESIWRYSHLTLNTVILQMIDELSWLFPGDALSVLVFTLPVPVFVEHMVQYFDFLRYLTDQMQVLFGFIPRYQNLSVEIVSDLNPH